MSDFDIVACGVCKSSGMRTGFVSCYQCSSRFCDENSGSDETCGIVCPICDWAICSNCFDLHSEKCWDKNLTPKLTSSDDILAKEYRFHDEKVLRSGTIEIHTVGPTITHAIKSQARSASHHD